MKKRSKSIFLVIAGLLFLFGAINPVVGQVQLTMCNTFSPGSVKTEKKLLQIFESEHPDIKVTYQAWVWKDYAQKLTVQYAGGAAPDVVMVHSHNTVPLVKAGGVVRLNDYIAQDPEVDVSKFWKMLAEDFTYHENGWYGLPYNYFPVNCVYYNKDMFKECGVPLPTYDWNVDEVLSAAQKIVRHDEKGRITRAGLYTYHPQQWIFMYGGDLVDDWKNPTKIRFNEPKGKAGLQMYIDLIHKYKVCPSPEGMKEFGLHYAQLFTQEKTGMVFTGFWCDVSEAKFDWDVAVNPYGPEGTRGFEAAWQGYGIMASSEHVDEAWQLVKFLSYDPRCLEARALNPIMNQMKRGGTTGDVISSRQDVTTKMFSEYKECVPEHKMWLLESLDYVRHWPKSTAWYKVWDELVRRGPFDLAVRGKITLEEALEEIVPKGNEILSGS